MVHLPFSSAGTGAGSRLEYEVYAKPKASASPSTPDKPTDPVKPDQPKQPNNEKSNPETSSNTSNIAPLFGPKTGDSTPIAGALLLLAAAIALIAWAVVRKRKQK